MATSILNHTFPCLLCATNRTITDNGDDTYTVAACSCGYGEAFLIIDPDRATAKPPWDKMVGGSV